MSTTIVSINTLNAHLSDPNWVVIDCRFNLAAPEEGAQLYSASHIPGARYAHLDNDLSSPKRSDTGRHPLPRPETFVDTLSKWGVSHHSQVIAYDDAGGMVAARLWWMLRWLGHEQVALLDGGFKHWQTAAYPLTNVLPVVQATQFKPRLHNALWVDSDFVGALHTEQGYVLDARAAPRFRGEIEPIDPVAGHIPGALNYPFEANLDETGQFLSSEALKTRFSRFANSPEKVIHSCGSGVTACHNLLAMEIAGLSGSRLYPGSWSEWITDPTRPIATGE
ncbi:MAG: sulfurtransferase [Pseudomonadota bacterium]